jgi:predicted secreted Zn-dependent protease
MKVKLDIKKTSSSTYNVKGKTYQEVFGALKKRKHQGEYTYDTAYTCKTDKSKNVTDVTITHKSNIEMPKWSDYSSASKEDKAKWDNMHSTLLCHEEKHHGVAEKALKALSKALTSAKKTDDKSVRSLIDSELKKHQASQDAFDKKTKHGTDDPSCQP